MTDPRDDERPAAVIDAPGEAPAAPAEAAPVEPEGVIDPDLARALGVGSGSKAPPRPLEPRQIRARRRPRAILFVWLWELVCALVIATPVHAWARAVWGAHPDGDAVLFRPGGHALLTWLADAGPALGIVVRTTFLLLIVLGILGQIVTGTLVALLAPGTGARGPAPSGWRCRRW